MEVKRAPEGGLHCTPEKLARLEFLGQDDSAELVMISGALGIIFVPSN